MLNDSYTFCKRLFVSPFPEKKLYRSDGAIFWQEKIFYSLSIATVYLGLITTVLSVVISLKNKLPGVAIFDIAIYIVVVVIILSRRLSTRVKSLVIVAAMYCIGVMILLLVGPYGAGLLWLFSFPVFAGIFLGLRGCYIALIVNGITLVLFSIIILGNMLPGLPVSSYSSDSWIVTGINFIMVNVVASLSMTILFDAMKKQQDHQIQIQNLLVEEHTKLAKARFDVEEHNMQISQFLANFSHELRSPLNAIIGFSSLIRNKTYSRDKQDLFFKIIEEKGLYLLQLINDVIDISKLGSNQLNLVQEPCKLYPIFVELLIYYQEETERTNKQNLSIILTVPEDLKSLSMTVDILRLKQIMINFISNALKFTDNGYIEFGFYTVNDHNIRFFVKDTGIGLDAADKKRIFLRYEQGSDFLQQNKEGIGLGLYITKNLVTMMNGKIWVESELNKGSTFIVEIPFEPVFL